MKTGIVKTALALCLLFLFSGLMAQGSFFKAIAELAGQNSIVKSIQKGEYAKAEEKLQKSLVKDSTDIELNYNAAYLYMQRKFKDYNAGKAYNYIQKSIRIFNTVTEPKELKKLSKIPIDANILQSASDTICLLAKNDALEQNTINAYNKYLSYYLKAPAAHINEIIAKRNSEAYKFACDTNSVASYDYFIEKYNGAAQITEATGKRNALAFAQAKIQDKISVYQNFIDTYTKAEEVPLARERIYELAFDEAARTNKSASYKKFIDTYPKNKLTEKAFGLFEKTQFQENVKTGDWVSFKNFISGFPENSLKTAALDSIYQIAIASRNIDVLTFCIDNFKGDKRNNALLLYHEIFTMDGEKFTLDMFYQKFDDEILRDVKIKDYELVTMAEKLQLQQPYSQAEYMKYDQFIRLAAPRDKAFAALQKMVQPDIETQNWKDALNKMLMYKPFFGTKNKKFNDLTSFLESH